MAVLPRPVSMMMFWMPDRIASSTPYWMMGLSTMGSISLGWALVAGRKRVPSPAAGKTAFRTLAGIDFSLALPRLLATVELYLYSRLCYVLVLGKNTAWPTL